MALVGLMGSGKTSVGRELARRLERPFIDLDRRIERRTGKTVAALFAEEGEQAFRSRERAELAQVLAAPPSVLATGGGVVVSEANRVALRDAAFVVWLEVRPETAGERVATDDGRPLLGADPLASLRGLSAEREELYRSVSHAVIDAGDHGPEELADLLMRNYLSDAGPRL